MVSKPARYSLTLTELAGRNHEDFAHPERDDKRLPGDWKDAHPDAIPSSPGDLDGSADVSRRVSVDVMRKPERHSLALTCGTDYDGFSTCSLVWRCRRFQHGFGHYDQTDRFQHVAHSFDQLHTRLTENGNTFDYNRRC